MRWTLLPWQVINRLKQYERMRSDKSIAWLALSSIKSAFAYSSSGQATRTPSFTNILGKRHCSYSRSKQLFSTVIDESSETLHTSVKYPIPVGSTMVATGSVLSFSPSSNSRNGIMVIKIREEDMISSDESRVKNVED